MYKAASRAKQKRTVSRQHQSLNKEKREGHKKKQQQNKQQQLQTPHWLCFCFVLFLIHDRRLLQQLDAAWKDSLYALLCIYIGAEAEARPETRVKGRGRTKEFTFETPLPTAAPAPGYAVPIATIYYNRPMCTVKRGICVKQTSIASPLRLLPVHCIIRGGTAALCYCLTRVVPAATTGSSAIQSAVRRRSFKERSDVKVSLASCRYSDLIFLLSSLSFSSLSHVVVSLSWLLLATRRDREKTTTAADNENSSFSPFESVYKCLPTNPSM